ncbi:glycosyltransferase family 9 protein [Morganella morganii]|nr:glycosyltransferase family 9 protein [Morganella morganii]
MRYSKILIVRIDFLGDMVCTTPLIEAVKNKWPESEIHVLANKYNAPILDNNPYVSCVHYYVYSKQCERNIKPGKFNALINRIALILRLRRLKFELGIIPNGGMHKNSIQFLRQLNIPDVRWHTGKTEFDDRNEEHVLNRPLVHECLSGFKLLPELNLPETNKLKYTVYPSSFLRKKWLNRIRRSNGYRVGLFVSNKSAERRWDISRWFNLIEIMGEDVDFFIFHDPKDNVNPLFYNEEITIVKTESIQDLIAAMSCMDLVVSADSAPVHLSSALNIPVVALFENRPEKYLRWYPVGVEYKLLKNKGIVNDIEPCRVAGAIKYFLTDFHLSGKN